MLEYLTDILPFVRPDALVAGLSVAASTLLLCWVILNDAYKAMEEPDAEEEG